MTKFVRTANISKNYKLISEVGNGTYGWVYKAKDLKNNNYVALKKIDLTLQEADGFPITAIREIKLLRKLTHPNIIRLLEIITTKASLKNNFRGSTILVFEYMEHDFVGLIRSHVKFKISQIKLIIQQILEGLQYLHINNIVHRDLKPANILLNNKGEVKLADFGLARQFTQHPDSRYTNKVVTLWYRAPELLLGTRQYSYKVDTWSIGCILGELLLEEVLFRGDKEPREMELIYELCGSPNLETWPEASTLPNYAEFAPKKDYEYKLRTHMQVKRSDLSEEVLDLLEKLLCLNPKNRYNTEETLNHRFFTMDPLPCTKDEMPKIERECHETLMIKKKKESQAKSLPQRQPPPLSDYPVKKVKFTTPTIQATNYTSMIPALIKSNGVSGDKKDGPKDFISGILDNN